MTKKLDRVVWLVLGGLALVGLGLVVYSQQVGLKPPARVAPVVGGRGPLGLVFSEQMKEDTVQSRLQVTPAVKGRLSWTGQTLWWWPEEPLAAGQALSLSLAAGAESRAGGVIRQDASWQVQVRPAEVAYISPAGEDGSLWMQALDAPQGVQMSLPGQQVGDFGVSLDGNWLAYSTRNEQQGYDVWLVDRQGKNQKKLVGCEADWCLQEAWAADGSRLAYTRQVVDTSGYPLGTSRLWTLDVSTGQTAPLYSDARIAADDPAWSPDGNWLAFADSFSKGIRVLDLTSSRDFVMSVQMGAVGGWSLDGETLYFADLESGSLPSFGQDYAVTPADGKITPLFAHGPDSSDHYVPVPSPDGQWIATGMRFVGGGTGRHLVLFSPDGSQQQVISDAEQVTNAAYSWSPDGQSLVYQQLALGSSTAKPGVMLWDWKSKQSKQVATNAYRPQWVP